MKNNRKFNPETYNRQVELEDDYENYGYEIKNAKRYQSRAKRTAKFRDYDEFEWEWGNRVPLVEVSTISPKVPDIVYCIWVVRDSTPMRKIERQMNAAIRDSKDWKNANTMVTNHDGVSFVFLHGNLIAEVGDTFIKLHDGGWQSNTTKSRLNAILNEHGCPGEGIFQKQFEWFMRLSDGTVIPFFSGMRLNWRNWEISLFYFFEKVRFFNISKIKL